jgi:Zn finger protein HypA/HybF involved in hydrogenase expression
MEAASRKTCGKLVLVAKCVFHLSLQCLFEIVFVPTNCKRATLEMVSEMRAGLCVNCKLSVTLSHFNINSNTYFNKSLEYQI